MNLQQFFSTYLQFDVALNEPVLVFTGKEYPLLFFSQLHQRLRSCGVPVTVLPAMSLSIAQLDAQLSVSLLGNRTLFWLGDAVHYDASYAKELWRLLQAYTGPHAVWLYSAQSTSTVRTTVSLPSTVDHKQFMQLVEHSSLVGVDRHRFTRELFSRISAISLEQACLLIQYASVVGNRADLFMQQWLEEIVVPERSLFALSSLLLAKKTNAFLSLWRAIEYEYSTPFWCSYWSEQLFRAYGYCVLMQKGQVQAAKRIGFRLPFSFLQADWRRMQPKRLIDAHIQLYMIDSALKNGASSEGQFLPLFTHLLLQ